MVKRPWVLGLMGALGIEGLAIAKCYSPLEMDVKMRRGEVVIVECSADGMSAMRQQDGAEYSKVLRKKGAEVPSETYAGVPEPVRSRCATCSLSHHVHIVIKPPVESSAVALLLRVPGRLSRIRSRYFVHVGWV